MILTEIDPRDSGPWPACRWFGGVRGLCLFPNEQVVRSLHLQYRSREWLEGDTPPAFPEEWNTTGFDNLPAIQDVVLAETTASETGGEAAESYLESEWRLAWDFAWDEPVGNRWDYLHLRYAQGEFRRIGEAGSFPAAPDDYTPVEDMVWQGLTEEQAEVYDPEDVLTWPGTPIVTTAPPAAPMPAPSDFNIVQVRFWFAWPHQWTLPGGIGADGIYQGRIPGGRLEHADWLRPIGEVGTLVAF